MIGLWAQVVAGLGLFFAGMELLSGNLRSLTSRRFQRAVAAWTETPLQGFLWGMLAGAASQSTSVVTFIVVGLLMARTIDVQRGLPIIAGANIGACGLLFVVSLDVGPAILILVGLVGVAVTLDRLSRWRTALWALFGVALLFVGLDFIKAGTAPLAHAEFVQNALEATGGSYVLAFVIGVVVTVVVHSSVAVGVLAMSLMAAGLFGFDTAFVIICASNVGSSVTTLLLSSKLHGEARQLAMFQVSFNVVGCLVFIPLFALEQSTGWPLLQHWLTRLTDEPDLRIAWTYMLFNASAVLLLVPLRRPCAALLARLWPRTAAEDAARPAYIGDFALGDPELAMELVHREHHRVYRATATLLDPLVGETEPGAPPPDGEATAEVLRATAEFLDDLGRQNLSAEQYETLYGHLDDQGHLTGLLNDVGRLSRSLAALDQSDGGRQLGRVLADALHAALHSCGDALARDADRDSIAIAQTLTADRGPVLRSVREAYVGERESSERESSVEAELATAMLGAISLFERIVWQVHAMVSRRAEAQGLVQDGAIEAAATA